MNVRVPASIVLVVLTSCVSVPPAVAPGVPKPEGKPATEKHLSALPVSIKLFKANGAPAGTITAAYDPRGLLASQQLFSSSGALVATKTGTLTERGWRVVETSPSGAVLSIEDRVLGTRGEPVSVVVSNARGVPVSVTEFEYDAAGRPLTTVCRSGDGRLRTRTVYSYDARGNNNKVEVFDATGTLNNVFERQFEGQRVVVEKGFDSSGAVVELTKTTWKEGRKLAQETVTPVSRLVEYSYDATDAPAAVVKYVRGEIVERQTIEYQWLTR